MSADKPMDNGQTLVKPDDERRADDLESRDVWVCWCGYPRKQPHPYQPGEWCPPTPVQHPRECATCEGGGSYSKLADCTTLGSDCACNGPRVGVDPCDGCGGSGRV